MIEVNQKWGIIKTSESSQCRHYRLYRPVLPFKEIKGLVLLIPGYTNHADVHYELCDFLSKKGYMVLALNLSGHGQSDGDRFSVKSFDQYVSDIRNSINRLVAEIPDIQGWVTEEEKRKEIKIHIIGHSHGALAAHYALEKTDHPDLKLVTSLSLVCPYYELNNKNYNLIKSIASIFSYILPHLKIPTGGIPENVIDDPYWISTVKGDVLNLGSYKFSKIPFIGGLLNGSKFTLSWANASAKAQKYVSENTKINIPIQFIIADADTVAVNSTTEKIFDKLKSNNPHNIFLKFQGKHDLMRCLVRETVFESILRFVESVKTE